MTKRTVLIIDDDEQIRRLLEINLTANEYTVSLATNGKEGILFAANHPPEIILLDLGLPDIHGLKVLKELRQWFQKPILVLTAVDQEDTIVSALDLGANDYIMKPFRTQELLARMRSALRSIEQNNQESVLDFGDIQLDLVARLLTKKDQIIKLTVTEYALISLLMRFSGRVLTYQFILKEVWGPGFQMETQYLRVYMGQLRKKIEDDPNSPQHLITESRVGYRFI